MHTEPVCDTDGKAVKLVKWEIFNPAIMQKVSWFGAHCGWLSFSGRYSKVYHF